MTMEDAVPLLGREQFLKDFDHFLYGMGIRHFRAYECADVGRRKGTAYLTPPPRSIWAHIIPTLKVLEDVRAHFKTPIDVNSGYRNKDYNANVGGKTLSLHVMFNAIDFNARGIRPLDVALYLTSHRLSSIIGVGLYRNFVHLDTRGTIGMRKSRWGNPPKWWEVPTT